MESEGVPNWAQLLFEATTVQHMEALLLPHHAHLNTPDASLDTPLRLAVLSRRLDWTTALLSLGCLPNLSLQFGLSVLHIAVRSSSPDIVSLLLAFGADPNLRSDDGSSPLSIALQRLDADCYVPLALAFVASHAPPSRPAAIFEALRAAMSTRSAAFVDAVLQRAGDGLPVVDNAVAWCANHVADGAVMQKLLARGGSPLAVALTVQQQVPCSAIVVASVFGNNAALSVLLEEARRRGLPLGLEDLVFGMTCLQHAARAGHARVCRALLAAGAVVDTEAAGGFTALCFACKDGHHDVAQLLLEHGASPHVRAGPGGETPLIVSRSPRVSELLLRHGADPNAVSAVGVTALVEAVRERDVLMVGLLLRYGADPERAHAELFAQCAPDRAPPPLDPASWLHPKRWLEDAPAVVAAAESTARLIARLIRQRGFDWIRWEPSTHALFPSNVRRTIRECLLCRLRPESLLSRLPRDVLLHVCSFVATPSPVWRNSSNSSSLFNDWEWSKRFTEKCWERAVLPLVSEEIQGELRAGQCSKVSGAHYCYTQPLYSCATCDIQGGRGVCRSCRDACHADHDTAVASGALAVTCSCGFSARCCITSRWDMLQAERDQFEANKSEEDAPFRYIVAITNLRRYMVEGNPQGPPERMLPAHAGDIIRVERRELAGRLETCEGTLLSGETGVFPTTRQAVRLLGDVCRALEDSGRREGELEFSVGDAILPMGDWDGDVPCGVIPANAIRARVLRPDREDSSVGWISRFAADQASLFSVFLRDGVNHKRRVLELGEEACVRARRSDVEAVPLLVRFRDEFVRFTQDLPFHGLSVFFGQSTLALAWLYELLQRPQDEIATLQTTARCVGDPNYLSSDMVEACQTRLVMAHVRISDRQAAAQAAAAIRAGLWRDVADCVVDPERHDVRQLEARLRAQGAHKANEGLWAMFCDVRKMVRPLQMHDALVEVRRQLHRVSPRPLVAVVRLCELGQMLEGFNVNHSRELLVDMWERHPEFAALPELRRLYEACPWSRAVLDEPQASFERGMNHLVLREDAQALEALSFVESLRGNYTDVVQITLLRYYRVCLRRLQRHEEALRLSRDVIAPLCEKLYGRCSDSVADTLMSTARDLLSLRRLPEASQVADAYLVLVTGELGRSLTSEHGSGLALKGRVLWAQGDPASALVKMQAALRLVDARKLGQCGKLLLDVIAMQLELGLTADAWNSRQRLLVAMAQTRRPGRSSGKHRVRSAVSSAADSFAAHRCAESRTWEKEARRLAVEDLGANHELSVLLSRSVELTKRMRPSWWAPFLCVAAVVLFGARHWWTQ